MLFLRTNYELTMYSWSYPLHAVGRFHFYRQHTRYIYVYIYERTVLPVNVRPKDKPRHISDPPIQPGESAARPKSVVK